MHAHRVPFLVMVYWLIFDGSLCNLDMDFKLDKERTETKTIRLDKPVTPGLKFLLW